MDERIKDLLTQINLEEKISLLAGADQWTTVPVERLGIPAIKVTDGPNGARGAGGRMGPTSACFPVGVALGATWNPELVGRVGAALGEEVKTKGAHILLAPTVNIHRSPLAGRNFECYSEDPHLTSRMAVAYIKGVQSQGVGACIKHFVCNDSEFERFTMSSEVAERPLREIYLPPFRAAVREADPWSVMSAYNKINGTWASENPYTLLDILKGEWGFKGIVMSDWYGTNSVGVANGGLDLEMPGPARWMGEKLLKAVQVGQVSEGVIDEKISRLLHVIRRAGAFENPELQPERAVDKPEHRQIARQAAAEAIVLLKNAGDTLPLNLEKLGSIAVIGQNADQAQIQGGGSAHVTPHYVVSPLEGIADKAGGSAEVGYEVGCAVQRMLPPLNANWLTTEDGSEQGLTLQMFDNAELAGELTHTQVTDRTQIEWFGYTVPYVDAKEFSVRLTGRFTAPETGTFAFNLMSVGLSRLFIDGEEVIDNWSEAKIGTETAIDIEVTAGQSRHLKVEYAWQGDSRWRSLRLGGAPAISADSIDKAAELASRSDVAIVFAGLTDEWESEGFDRPDMELPGDQVKLIEKVVAANPNTIVVLNTGSPITMNWLNKVPAVVQAWYTGQEAGNAVADVLFGDVNPSGKLPTTFPKHLRDNPAYINYPGEHGKVYYGEGLFVGYRYYDKKDVEPLFPFGYGLSYTTFAYRKLALSSTEYAPGEEIQVSLEVENTGSRAGQEVVQLYVRDVESSLMRPEKELKAFAKVALEPGETKTITFTLKQDALSFYNPVRRGWVAEAGNFEVLVGSSSRDIRLTGHLVLKGDFIQAGTARLHIGLALQELLDDEDGKAVLEKHIPEVLEAPQLSLAMGMSLEKIAGFVPQILTPEKLEAINEDLVAV
jgi:beta-glucosidase